MYKKLISQLNIEGASLIQKIWVADLVYASLPFSEHLYPTYKIYELEGFQFRIYPISQILALVQVRQKCENIDEEIATCSKKCGEEYDECCKKWKEHWAKYDEAIDHISHDLEQEINEF